MNDLIAITHGRFRRVERNIFVHRVTADCMNHTCRLRKHGDLKKLDACCQYGVDADLGERDAILAREEEIRALLDELVAEQPWFHDRETLDKDFPSGAYVRTTTHDKGCVFLHHSGRGCAIHRASLAGGWDFHGVKPHVCRLFPLTYDQDSIVLSDDYDDYSCSQDQSAPSVYRVSRDALAEIFDQELVMVLDQVERDVCSTISTSVPPIAVG